MGARLTEWGPPVDRVISSSAVRALTTAEVITQEMGLPWDEILVEEALERALKRQGNDASIVVLTHGGETLPVLKA